MRDQLPYMTTDDISFLASLPRFSSLRALARHHRRQPQNVSVTLKKLESMLGFQVAHRSTNGIRLTPEGQRVCDRASDITEQLSQMLSKESVENTTSRTLTFCSRGFLVNAVCGPLINLTDEFDSSLEWRILDLSPTRTEEAARHNLMDCIVSFGDINPGLNWTSKKVGMIHWSLFAKADHPLFLDPDYGQFSGYPVLGHVYWDQGTLVSNEIPRHLRMKGLGQRHEIQNSTAGLEMIKNSDNLAYLPEIAVRENLERGIIRKVELGEDSAHSQAIYIHFNMDTIPKSFARKIEDICNQCFS